VQTRNVEEIRTHYSDPQNLPVYDSARRGIIPLVEFREVLRYRSLIYHLVRRDVVARYKRSFLGVIWTMLNPLGMMIVLSIVFSQMFRQVESYPAYVLSGIVAWTFFSQTTSAAISSLVWGGDFFQRIYLPRSTFAISAIGTGLVNLLLSLIPLFAIMLVTGRPIHLTVLFIPVPILLLACFSLGIGLLISSLAIYFPDVVEMYQIVLQAWFYFTPILYTPEALPEQFRSWLQYNPMAPLITLFRLPIYDGRLPTLAEFLPALLISLVSISVGWWIFTRKSDEFAYRT
jgi:ABC-type polysaccharide/polyol phosphate export permease